MFQLIEQFETSLNGLYHSTAENIFDNVGMKVRK